MQKNCLNEMFLLKPADLDLHCYIKEFYIWFHTVFERVNHLSTKVYKQIFYFIQVKFSLGSFLVPGQVENFTFLPPPPPPPPSSPTPRLDVDENSG